MSFTELRRDCARNGGIGPLFWTVLVGVCARVTRRYPPASYNGGEQWTEESIRDLAQEVTLQRLLGENQLGYVMDLATDEDSLARLLAFQVRRVLAHRRSATVVDRLLRRIEADLERLPYETIALGSDRFIAGQEAPRTAAGLADTELRHGAALIASVPRIPSNPAGERESKVYSSDDLRDVLARLVTAFHGILLSDVRKILEIALTAWLPTILREHEEDFRSDSSPELELQRSAMTSLIFSVSARLDDVQRRVLLGKSQDISDGELARRIGRSRPWIADRKAEVLAIVEHELIRQLPEALHGDAVRGLLDHLASEEEVSS